MEAAGKDWDEELRNLYVSPHIAKALLKVYPDFADSAARGAGTAQGAVPQGRTTSPPSRWSTPFATRSRRDGKFPLTLIALDEVQQYIGENPTRAYRHPGGHRDLLQALRGAPALRRHRPDRALRHARCCRSSWAASPSQIELSDADVETVIRKVILAKKPEHDRVQSTRCSPTTSARSRATSPAPRSSTAPDDRRRAGPRLPDAAGAPPVLGAHPARRRSGRHRRPAPQPAQGRPRGRPHHGRRRPLGTVVAGDFIYDQNRAQPAADRHAPPGDLRATSRSSRGGDDGRPAQGTALRPHLPDRQAARARPEPTSAYARTPTPSPTFWSRTSAPAASSCASASLTCSRSSKRPARLMRVGDEYRLQTRESSAWNEEYPQPAQPRSSADPQRVANERADLLRKECGDRLKGVTAVRASARSRDRAPLHFGPERRPRTPTRRSTSGSATVGRTTRSASSPTPGPRAPTRPTVFVFFPVAPPTRSRRRSGAFAPPKPPCRCAECPTPPRVTRPDRPWRRARADADRGSPLSSTRSSPAPASSRAAGKRCSARTSSPKKSRRPRGRLDRRLYPQFDVADHPKWGKVIDRARKGDGAALEAVGHTEEVDKHPVPSAILKFVGVGKKGAEIRKNFDDSPYGWPRDAIDGGTLRLGADAATCAPRTPTTRSLDAKAIDRAKLTQIELPGGVRHGQHDAADQGSQAAPGRGHHVQARRGAFWHRDPARRSCGSWPMRPVAMRLALKLPSTTHLDELSG